MTRAEPWVLATRSAGKLRELRPLFGALGIDVIDLEQAGIAPSAAEESVESYETFEENAVAKARYFSTLVGARAVVADDSGLEVAALGGAPGVRSRRWSGRLDLSASELEAANNALLVERMRGQPDRRARFVCAAAWCPGGGNGGEAVVVRGEVHGRIVDQPSGVHGFGYDAYFHSDELDRTLADATVDEKQQVSHRGRAFVALVDALRARGVAGGRGEFG